VLTGCAAILFWPSVAPNPLFEPRYFLYFEDAD
jgi:hypothetical protein